MNAQVGSARNVTIEPSTPWSFAQPVMTAPSFTQYTYTAAIPFALSASCCAKYPHPPAPRISTA